MSISVTFCHYFFCHQQLSFCTDTSLRKTHIFSIIFIEFRKFLFYK